jgi:hypothetical protein
VVFLRSWPAVVTAETGPSSGHTTWMPLRSLARHERGIHVV